MALNKIFAKFGKEYDGEVITPTGKILIGSGEGKILPYDMIFGALGSCMFYYFHKFANQRKIQFDSVTVEVTGTKRETPPTMLNSVNVKYIVKNGAKEKGLKKSAELSSKYCSVYQTISAVAKMSCEIEFV